MMIPTSLHAQTAIQKVEPPHWWVGSSISPLRLLLTGEGLSADQLTWVAPAGMSFDNARASDNGHYLFVDLKLAPDVAPAQHQVVLQRDGRDLATFRFEVRAADSSPPRLGGYTPDDVIYFVMPDRFADGDVSNNDPAKSKGLYDRKKVRSYHGGDLAGLEQRFDYIQSLGATAIWTTPIYDNNDGPDLKEVYPTPDGRRDPTTGYHGYGAIDMYAVDEHLGDLALLQEVVAQAHRRGIRMIQDQVANHTGPYHRWASDPPTATWWNGTLDNHLSNNWQKWTAMNPRATRQTQKSNIDGWFIDVLPDFNQDDPEVRQYLIQNSIWWLRTVGYDAIRMDTLPHVPRTFWQAWASAIKNECPDINILGELFDADPVLLSYYQAGRAGHDGIDTHIDTLFDFGLFTPIRNCFARGRSLRELNQMLARDWIYPNPDVLTTFIGVHDMQRFMNEDKATLDGLKLAFAFILTSRGTPLIYYGDEIAMPGGGDPDNRRDFPGGFAGDGRDAFTAAGRSALENDVWQHVAKLARLRREHLALRRGRSLDLYEDDQQMAYARVADDQAAIVAINNAPAAAKIAFDVSMLPTADMAVWRDALGGRETVRVAEGVMSLTLPPRTAAVYLPQP